MNNKKPRYNEVVFTKEQEKLIVELYTKNQLSSVKIGKQFDVSHKVIAKVLDKYNVPRVGNGHRKYQLNEHYFDKIDTPNKAYILGFLYSDGCNYRPKQTISISLQEEDKDILEQMRKEIGSEKPLEFIDCSNKHDFGYAYKNQYRLLMFSSHMSDVLNSLGVCENKSLKLTFPDWLDESLYSHFIRGVFDGDGSISRSIKNENNHAVTITITSTDTFCQRLQEICKNKLNINTGIYDASCHNGITKVFTLSGRNIAKTFLDWIYQDADMYLDRKYKRYLDYYNIAV